MSPDRWTDASRRLLDLALGVPALIFLAPALLLIAWRIKRGDGGPALYRGLRAGRGGASFHILKFRTMVVNAEKLGSNSTPEDDPRITPLGRFLRARKLDELPQLLNVVRGEMALVGPRPQVLEEVATYSDAEKALLDVRPGITDFASIRFRNEGEILKGSSDPYADYRIKIRPEKMRLGLLYVRVRSVTTDVRILFATVGALLGWRWLDFAPPDHEGVTCLSR